MTTREDEGEKGSTAPTLDKGKGVDRPVVKLKIRGGARPSQAVSVADSETGSTRRSVRLSLGAPDEAVARVQPKVILRVPPRTSRKLDELTPPVAALQEASSEAEDATWVPEGEQGGADDSRAKPHRRLS